MALLQSCDDNNGFVHALICSPPRNTGSLAKILILEHDWLRLQDMNQFVKLISLWMDVGAQEHIFCSAL